MERLSPVLRRNPRRLAFISRHARLVPSTEYAGIPGSIHLPFDGSSHRVDSLGMRRNLQRHWKQFRSGTAGKRFQDRYQRNREVRSHLSPWARLFRPVVAVLLILVGATLCLVPGPGLPLILVGAGLLADRSRPVAVLLDRIEAKGRGLFDKLRAWWFGSSTAAKGAVALSVFVVVGGFAYGLMRIVLGR